MIKKGVFLCKSLNNCRYLGMEELPQQFIIKNSSINLEFLINRTGGITARAYPVSVTKIVSNCQYIGIGVLLIINN